jgi:hypothetical protein
MLEGQVFQLRPGLAKRRRLLPEPSALLAIFTRDWALSFRGRDAAGTEAIGGMSFAPRMEHH